MHQARTFGVLSPFVGGDYYGAIIAGINRAAASEGNRIIAFAVREIGERLDARLHAVDGLASNPGSPRSGSPKVLLRSPSS